MTCLQLVPARAPMMLMMMMEMTTMVTVLASSYSR